MSILRMFGLGGQEQPKTEESTQTVRRIVRELETLERDRARYVAAFAFILSRVANADLVISDEETCKMEEIVQEFGGLPEDQAVLVVQIAKSQNRLLGSTENFLVTREFKEISTPEQRRQLLDCVFRVSAADGSISSPEEVRMQQIARELGLTDREYVEIRSSYSRHREVLKPLLKKDRT